MATRKRSTTVTAKKKTAAAPRTRQPKAGADAILDAVSALLSEGGLAALAPERVAERAEITVRELAKRRLDDASALSLALFERHLAAHDARARAGMRERYALGDRLRVTLEAALAISDEERRELAALSRVLLDAESEAWLFGDAGARSRKIAIDLFKHVARADEVPADMRDLVALTLFLVHLGIFVRFVHDRSRGQRQTRALIDAAVDLAPTLAILIASPFATVARTKILRALRDGGVLPAELLSLAKP